MTEYFLANLNVFFGDTLSRKSKRTCVACSTGGAPEVCARACRDPVRYRFCNVSVVIQGEMRVRSRCCLTKLGSRVGDQHHSDTKSAYISEIVGCVSVRVSLFVEGSQEALTAAVSRSLADWRASINCSQSTTRGSSSTVLLSSSPGRVISRSRLVACICIARGSVGNTSCNRE